MILANISPSGSAIIIMMADVNHENASVRDIVAKLYIARYK